ncbi:29004_t:CDS:1 [Racocetra persica]|uniref:29004_t:CDS:1 n=1 Tax=Racocetra persica TaxID=160502 RepID=A0ACA9SN92_9GLOM|nr:29004_t:CDS:1 [Racocetra persica]
MIKALNQDGNEKRVQSIVFSGHGGSFDINNDPHVFLIIDKQEALDYFFEWGGEEFTAVALTDNHIINQENFSQLRQFINSPTSYLYFTDEEINTHIDNYQNQRLDGGENNNPACQRFAEIYEDAQRLLEIEAA